MSGAWLEAEVDSIESRAELRTDFETVASPPMTISPDTTVSDAIDQFQAEHQELALVFEDGTVVGLVTVTDLLEEVVGDIQDSMDAAAGVA